MGASSAAGSACRDSEQQSRHQHDELDRGDRAARTSLGAREAFPLGGLGLEPPEHALIGLADLHESGSLIEGRDRLHAERAGGSGLVGVYPVEQDEQDAVAGEFGRGIERAR